MNDPNSSAEKKNTSRTKFEYQVTGKLDLENQMDFSEPITDIWREFKLETPIPVKKDHYFALGSKDNSSTSFSYFFPSKGEHEDKIHSHHEFIQNQLKTDEYISLSGDRAQLCLYYTLSIGYQNWSEKRHLNYPLSFRNIVPITLFYLKKKMKVPRVLIYHIFRMF